MREQQWALVGIALVGYLFAYVAIWFTRTECDALMAVACGIDAAMKGAGDLIQFAWVWKNPEIAAGSMTLVAALTVFATLNQQRQWAVADASAQRRDGSLAAVINVRHAFQRVFNSLYAMGNSNPNTWAQFKKELDGALDNLRLVMSANAAGLGASVATSSEIIMSDIVDILRDTPPGVRDSLQIRLAIGMTVIIGRYLDSPELLISPDGRVAGGPIAEPEGFEERLKDLNLTREFLRQHLGGNWGDYFLEPESGRA